MAMTTNTQNPDNQRLGGSRWFRLLSVLFAIGLIASACGADDAATEAAGEAADVVEDAVDAVDAGDDSALVQSFDDDKAMDDEEAMEDDEECRAR